MTPRTLVILNPKAGGGAEGDRIQEWKERRPDVELRRTEKVGDAERWAREAARDGWRLVVAAGGDGTVHEVACGLLRGSAEGSGNGGAAAGAGPRGNGRAGNGQGNGHGTGLAILPLGTGNDLIRSLSVPGDLDEALEILDRGQLRDLDVVRLELDGEGKSHFFNAVTGGFSGAIHDALDEDVKERWGPLSYLRSGLETWGERRTYELEVEVNGETRRHEALNLVVANGGFAGHGLPVAPGADPFDGTLEILLILDAPTLELSGLAARMLTGESPEHDALVRLQGRSCRVRSHRPLPVSIDGEPTEAEELFFEMEPGALPILVGS